MSKHTFDWHKEEHTGRSGSFLGWMVPTVLAKMPMNDVEHLGEVTDGWRNVELGVTINGIEVDTKEFVAGIQDVIEQQSEIEAGHMIESIAGFEQLREDVDELTAGVRERGRRLAKKAGFDFPYEERW